MTHPTPTDPQLLHEKFDRVWRNPPGLGALTAVNHTAVGIRFMVTGGVFFLIGGLLAMLIRTQLALPDQSILTPEIYNQVFTMHGTVMMFLFAIPVLEGFAVYLIPKMIGTRDLAFPRLSALGYWCYLFGGIILLSSLFFSVAPDSGWFMYTPLSSRIFSPDMGEDFWLLGITFVEISAVSAGVELVVSILRTRAKGMSLLHMPLFAWYILAMALMIVIGFPPLILGSILLELERAADIPFFDVARGGDPILWQHLFWLFGHPEVYIIFLPAAGIVSTILPVFAQRPILGYRWIVLAVIFMGFISFGLWVHHMFAVGIPHMAEMIFSVTSMMVAIPTTIQVFAWLATLWVGRPVYSIPMLWIIGFLVIFVAGGLTGVMLALVPFDWQVHDTHFVVAHFHYVLVGGMFFPVMAAVYYWLPHFSGRMPSDSLAKWGFWLTFIGFNATFLIMHWTGLMGMPRRVYTYDAGLGWDIPNLISSIGGFILAGGAAAILLDLFLHFRFGTRAKPNPWNADTLEWATTMPVSSYNFISLPECRTRHPLWEQPGLRDSIAAGQHQLVEIEHGRRELLGTDPVTGEVREIMHVPGNTWIPLLAALAIGGVCLSLLFKIYWWAAAFSLVSLGFLLRWSWVNGAHPGSAPNGDTGPDNPPLHSRGFSGPGLWGMAVSLMADGAFYLSLIFGWFFLWTVAPQWQFPDQPPVAWLPLLVCGLLLSAAQLNLSRCVLRLRRRRDDGLGAALGLTTLVGLAHVALLVWILWRSDLAPRATTHDALILVVLVYQLLHSGLAVIMTGLQAWRVRIGYVNAAIPYEPGVVHQWWVYTTAVFWLSFAAVILVPRVWGGA